MVLVLGIVALVVVVAGVAVALLLASRQAREDGPPSSVPTDFVAPISSGGYSWRRTDESLEDFQARIARMNEGHEPETRP